MFTLENTTGYTQEQLDKMNQELQNEVLKWYGNNPYNDIRENPLDIIQVEKICSDIVFNRNC